ncbi:MAG TPA: hypothetical protein P5228_11050 [Bacteroidales bacterium]|nr:hypothetical protein [Bacteroidales bacterium]HRZ49345.1 hypothetical protein [Bacteroidales bacterium]
MLSIALGIFFTAIVVIGGLGMLIYVIVNRVRQKDKENFPDRDN